MIFKAGTSEYGFRSFMLASASELEFEGGSRERLFDLAKRDRLPDNFDSLEEIVDFLRACGMAFDLQDTTLLWKEYRLWVIDKATTEARLGV